MDNNNDIKLVRMKKAANALFSDIKTQAFPADMIVLFGSFAKDSINEYSDMDVCIVSDEDLSIPQKRSIENYFYRMAQNEFKLDFVYCDKGKLKNGTQVFAGIRKEGRIIYERL
ncbi:MAG: nucleotidyltransferase domain-containing protein [Defluviitaleaceae bacterium]|nr:nucleotidyltransferase domain-containing protein [Defluviitaleaceae bacterium]